MLVVFIFLDFAINNNFFEAFCMVCRFLEDVGRFVVREESGFFYCCFVVVCICALLTTMSGWKAKKKKS